MRHKLDWFPFAISSFNNKQNRLYMELSPIKNPNYTVNSMKIIPMEDKRKKH
jgi:hypothetical protein